MLCRDGDRLAEPQLERGIEALFARPPLALVGDDDDRAPRGAHQTGKHLVGRRHALARIEDEQHEVGIGQRRLGLLAHALRDRSALGLLETGGVDEGHRVAGELRLALAPVARQPRHVGDERGRLRVSRLNNVDLPTLGRPMMAMTGVAGIGGPGWAARRRTYRAIVAAMIDAQAPANR